MTLLDVRTKFVRDSGRYDLITDDVTFNNNGADRFINDGSKVLDRKVDIDSSISRTYQIPNAGIWYVTFPGIRAIKRVYTHNESERKELRKSTYTDLSRLLTKPMNQIENGIPRIYCIGNIRAENAATIGIPAQFFDSADNNLSLDTISFYPPTNGLCNIEVWGLWYNHILINNNDENVWTLKYPELLVWAALYVHEVSRRNTTGANDWLTALTRETDEIDSDMVEADIIDQCRVRDV